MRFRPPPRRLPLLALALLLLPACTEAKETWRFDTAGGGTYLLHVRWNADLWQRVGGVLGTPVLRRIEGRPFPLTAAAWRESVADVKGVTVVSLANKDGGKGWRTLEVELKFTSLKALLGVEPIARRNCTARVVKPKRAGAPRSCVLEMTPLTALPVLDPLAALWNALDQPPAEAKRRATPKDQTPLRRLGVEPGEAALVRRLLEPALRKVNIVVRIEAPGQIQRVGKTAVTGQQTTEAEFRFDFAALRAPATTRGVSLAWRLGKHDVAPAMRHTGDRPDAAARQIRK